MQWLRYGMLGIIGLFLIQPMAAHAQQPTNEPSSPEIRYCKKGRDINGVWKLTSLYEEPAGKLVQERKAKPHQYILLNNKGIYYQMNSKKRFNRMKQIRNQLVKNSGQDVWQYVVGKQGVVYFYKNQVFSHSVHCARVTKTSGAYKRGNIILTPTDSGNVLVYQTYRKLGVRKKAAKPKAAQQTKAKKQATQPTQKKK